MPYIIIGPVTETSSFYWVKHNKIPISPLHLETETDVVSEVFRPFKAYWNITDAVSEVFRPFKAYWNIIDVVFEVFRPFKAYWNFTDTVSEVFRPFKAYWNITYHAL
jgi:hypothetical protein